MHGGRRSRLGLAFKEHAQAELRRPPEDPPLSLEATIDRLEIESRDPDPDRRLLSVSRRDLLKAGGVLGAGFALAACTTKSSAGSVKKPTPHDARVVIVGAGLAGTAAAYQLGRAGVPSQLYEARDRIGGRCWSARDFANGQIAEHGGEFIDTRHVHIRQLAHQLGLELDDLFAGYAGSFSPIWVHGRYLHHTEIHPQMERIRTAVTKVAERIGVIGTNGKATERAMSYRTATPGAMEVDRLSMAAWLDQHVPDVRSSAVGQWIDEIMCGWYGLNLTDLSALNWMDYFLIPYPGADERWHVRGGNDQVPHRAVATLPPGDRPPGDAAACDPASEHRRIRTDLRRRREAGPRRPADPDVALHDPSSGRSDPRGIQRPQDGRDPRPRDGVRR